MSTTTTTTTTTTITSTFIPPLLAASPGRPDANYITHIHGHKSEIPAPTDPLITAHVSLINASFHMHHSSFFAGARLTTRAEFLDLVPAISGELLPPDTRRWIFGVYDTNPEEWRDAVLPPGTISKSHHDGKAIDLSGATLEGTATLKTLPNGMFHLGLVAVNRMRAREGIGAHLLDCVEGFVAGMAGADGEVVMVDTLASIPAQNHRYYEQRGYVQVGEPTMHEDGAWGSFKGFELRVLEKRVGGKDKGKGKEVAAVVEVEENEVDVDGGLAEGGGPMARGA